MFDDDDTGSKNGSKLTRHLDGLSVVEYTHGPCWPRGFLARAIPVDGLIALPLKQRLPRTPGFRALGLGRHLRPNLSCKLFI